MPIHTLSDIITQIVLEQYQFEYPSCFLIPNPDFISFGAKRKRRKIDPSRESQFEFEGGTYNWQIC